MRAAPQEASQAAARARNPAAVTALSSLRASEHTGRLRSSRAGVDEAAADASAGVLAWVAAASGAVSSSVGDRCGLFYVGVDQLAWRVPDVAAHGVFVGGPVASVEPGPGPQSAKSAEPPTRPGRHRQRCAPLPSAAAGADRLPLGVLGRRPGTSPDSAGAVAAVPIEQTLTGRARQGSMSGPAPLTALSLLCLQGRCGRAQRAARLR